MRILFICFLLTGCIEAPKTLHTIDGRAVTCAYAMQDEGGVCWHGHSCGKDGDVTECIK